MSSYMTVNKERKDTKEEFILRLLSQWIKNSYPWIKTIDLTPCWLDTMLNYSCLFSIGITVIHECSTPIEDNIDNFFTVVLYHLVRCQ